MHGGDEAKAMHAEEAEEEEHGCCGTFVIDEGVASRLDDEAFEKVNQSMCRNISNMLRIVSPSVQCVMQAHTAMNREINGHEAQDKQIPTRKLKQYSKLTHGLSLWSCCLDVIYESVECALCVELKMPHKMWSKCLQSATKMRNKLSSNQYGEAALELAQCMDHCQNWLDKLDKSLNI